MQIWIPVLSRESLQADEQSRIDPVQVSHV